MPAPRKSVLANPNRPGSHQHASPASKGSVSAPRPGGSQAKAKSDGGPTKARPGGSQPKCGC